MTRFQLQFDLADVRAIASRYSYEDDAGVLEIGADARDRGWYTRDEFIHVCRWKSPRTQPLVVQNQADGIEDAIRRALSSIDEEARMRSMLQLRGVSWPTASVLLHLAHRDPYPILDYRALEALGVNRRSSYSMRFWLDYVRATRALAKAAHVEMRTLDRALWQWSRDRRDLRRAGSGSITPQARGSGSLPVNRASEAVEPDAVVIGCVSSKQRGPAKARDLYTSPLFQKRRHYAEESGRPWVIFSAEHGILDPDDVIGWYDVALARLPVRTRRQKGVEAAAQLEDRFGPLEGKVFEIHAGDAYVSALREPAEALGARIINPLAGLGIGHQLQWYGRLRE